MIYFAFDQNPLKPIVLSHHYWPNVASKGLKLPKALRKFVLRLSLPQGWHIPLTIFLHRMQNDYTRSFRRVKQDKHLKFFNMLGSVSLTLELQDRTATFDVTLLQATVVDAFSSKGVCRIDADQSSLSDHDRRG
jgi:hypothetical protein